jgi:hypothetical protein
MLKFANSTCAVRYDGRIVRVAEGDPWHATDPFVIDRPDLFSDEPPIVFGVRGPTVNVVEDASARPGAKRAVRRTS